MRLLNVSKEKVFNYFKNPSDMIYIAFDQGISIGSKGGRQAIPNVSDTTSSPNKTNRP